MSIRTVQRSKVKDLVCHKACEHHTHLTRSIGRSKIFDGPLLELIVYSVALVVALVALQSLRSYTALRFVASHIGRLFTVDSWL